MYPPFLRLQMSDVALVLIVCVLLFVVLLGLLFGIRWWRKHALPRRQCIWVPEFTFEDVSATMVPHCEAANTASIAPAKHSATTACCAHDGPIDAQAQAGQRWSAAANRSWSDVVCSDMRRAKCAPLPSPYNCTKPPLYARTTFCARSTR